jgi:septum formation protein
MKLLLASASPRRLDLLQMSCRVPHRVCAPDIDERPRPGEEPVAYAARMATEKAATVEVAPDEVALSADTVVHIEGEILGKPKDAHENGRMLARLSGQAHSVTTGWCLRLQRDQSGGDLVGTVTTTVHFRVLSDDEIAHHASTGEGWDKAGGYGIQGLGAALIDHVDGDHSNVVGLPLTAVLPALDRLGVT